MSACRCITLNYSLQSGIVRVIGTTKLIKLIYLPFFKLKNKLSEKLY